MRLSTSMDALQEMSKMAEDFKNYDENLAEQVAQSTPRGSVHLATGALQLSKKISDVGSTSQKSLVNFRIDLHVDISEQIIISGNTQELGGWNPFFGVYMAWHEGDFWTASIEVDDSDSNSLIEFKYVIQDNLRNTFKWEDGPNRTLDCAFLKPVANLRDIWNQRRFVLQMNFPLAKRLKMYVYGSIPQLGSEVKRPIKMKSILRKKKEAKFVQYWQLEFFIPSTLPHFYYRYCIVDNYGGGVTWERDPDRLVSLKKGKTNAVSHFYMDSSSNEKSKYGFVNKKDCVLFTSNKGKFKRRDVNFSADFVYNKINQNLFIGPYVHSFGEIMDLKKNGIKAVLNLQTQEDMLFFGIDIDKIKKMYDDNHMKLQIFPITDMNESDFEAKVADGIQLLSKLVERYQKVYVHCSAGVYRAPKLVACYLVEISKMKARGAVEVIRENREAAEVDENLIKQYLSKVHD